MNQKQTKCLLFNVLGTVLGLAVNIALDKKLAKAENPGFFNKGYRKMLKNARVWGPVSNAVFTAVQLSLLADAPVENTKYVFDTYVQTAMAVNSIDHWISTSEEFVFGTGLHEIRRVKAARRLYNLEFQQAVTLARYLYPKV